MRVPRGALLDAQRRTCALGWVPGMGSAGGSRKLFDNQTGNGQPKAREEPNHTRTPITRGLKSLADWNHTRTRTARTRNGAKPTDSIGGRASWNADRRSRDLQGIVRTCTVLAVSCQPLPIPASRCRWLPSPAGPGRYLPALNVSRRAYMSASQGLRGPYLRSAFGEHRVRTSAGAQATPRRGLCRPPRGGP